MRLYVIERTFAEQLDLTDDDVRLIDEIGADEGVHWLFSFLSADRRRTYCLYEAPSPEAITAAAARAGLPVDAIVEVSAGVPSSPAASKTGPPPPTSADKHASAAPGAGQGRRPDRLLRQAACGPHPPSHPAQR
jgi:hypothetical protein